MLGPGNEPLWGRLCVRPGGDHWAASIVADAVEPPRAGELKGTGVFGDTPTEAKELALRYVGGGVEQS
jgi:hypothetical protein